MKKADNFNPGKWLVENKITFQSRLNESINFPEMEDEFRGAMETGDFTEEDYLQYIIDTPSSEIDLEGFYEVENAIEQGDYSQNQAIKLMKSWAKEKLSSLSKSRINEDQINNKYVVKDEELSDQYGDFYTIDINKALDYLSQFNSEDVDAEAFIDDDEGWGEFVQYIDNVEQMSDEELEDAMRKEMSLYFFSDEDSI
jgi:hypothetical protein